ncbi:LemA family protein [Patescibacteria group bacterium]|nr:LemA family protein [Patescibacteria group bacterium]MCL5114733.1 LemA family protein [Patescibacteria group bacterium]
MTPSTIIAIVVALVVLWLIFAFNGLVRKKNRVQEAWSDIEVQLKRRYDLIPNLVETVKGYATHERTVLEDVTNARVAAMGAVDPKAKLQANDQLSNTLKSLFAVAENYPNLKANENFAKLQDELTDTEDKIQAARRFYNANVRDFNTSIQVFPTNLIAGTFHFTKQELFDVDNPAEREPVKVQF